jgi:hypothetical protein
MKSIIALAGSFLIAASAFAAEPQKPLQLAANGAAVVKTAQRAPAKNATGDSRFDNYALESMGCCGLK